MEDFDLRTLQKIQLYMLLEIRRICTLHNISYFLTGGTLLGAVRHQGFIPWDDDIDVAMPRKDYEKFKLVCETDLSHNFFLQTRESDPDFLHSFAKLRLRGTKRLGYSEPISRENLGIDIDIFPYDDVPSDIRANIQYYLCMMLRGIYMFKLGYLPLNSEKSLKKRVGLVLCRFISCFMKRDTVPDLINSIAERYNNQNYHYSLCLVGASYSFRNERMRKEFVMNYSEIPFEGYLFSAPKRYDDFLKTLYGDYMTLPPKDQQRPHIIDVIDFGMYGKCIDQYLSQYPQDV